MDTVLCWPYGQHTQLVAQELWKRASRASLASQPALYKTRVLLEEQDLRHVMPQAHIWMRALTAQLLVARNLDGTASSHP